MGLTNAISGIIITISMYNPLWKLLDILFIHYYGEDAVRITPNKLIKILSIDQIQITAMRLKMVPCDIFNDICEEIKENHIELKTKDQEISLLLDEIERLNSP